MPKRDVSENGAALRRGGKSFAVVPRIPCGYSTDFSVLRRIAKTAERYGARAIKVTSSQRIAIVGVTEGALRPSLERSPHGTGPRSGALRPPRDSGDSGVDSQFNNSH
jgi:NAD(P)H-nitrite reductase large subunit